MRLQIFRSKNSASFYVIKTVYIDGKEKTIIVEKLGTYDQLLKKLNGQDPVEWAKKYVEELNKIVTFYYFKKVFDVMCLLMLSLLLSYDIIFYSK